jgi:hypothetical protein
MDFFDDRYSPANEYYDENDEKEREKALASMLQAAAAAPDISTEGLHTTPEAHPNSASDSADFINILANNTILQAGDSFFSRPYRTNHLYWSPILYSAMNRRATLRGSYGTIPALIASVKIMSACERYPLEDGGCRPPCRHIFGAHIN